MMAVVPSSSGPTPSARAKIEDLAAAVVRFAGDASDGMQLVGAQFTSGSASHGNAVFTLPDLPAEIRAPAGTLAGACGFQVHVSSQPIHTPGDVLHTLVVMNPASLRANLNDLEPGGILIANADAFTPDELAKAGYRSNPLQDGSLGAYRLLAATMTQFSLAAVAPVNLIPREANRCKDFFPLGIVCWLYDRPLEPTLKWIRETYVKNPAMIEANTRTLKAGYHYGEMSGQLPTRYRIAKAALPAGRYRSVTGIESLALGIAAAAEQSPRPLIFAGFPAPPASELLHELFDKPHANVKVVQAEDDSAALNLAIGAAFGGALGATATSGPGLVLQSEALGLAVMSELPCIVIDVQRAGPSNGMPTKTEQADLLQALFGRNGESPLIVLAPATPADGFAIVLEAVRLAVRSMSPVIILSDVHLANSAEAWRVPSVAEVPAIDMAQALQGELLSRDERGVRPWAIPGTPGLEHRTGGLEKDARTGNVSYEALNHEQMVRLRAAKIASLADEIAPLETHGPISSDLLVVGWGSTFGAIRDAVTRCQAKGLRVAHAHVRHLHPLPSNTGAVLKRYRKILVPELNAGQLCRLLRAEYLVDAMSLSKVQGQPFLVSEIAQKIEAMLAP